MIPTLDDTCLNIINTICIKCRNYTGGGTCTAFPEDIPNDILDGSFIHTKPYPGDHGIQFEPA